MNLKKSYSLSNSLALNNIGDIQWEKSFGGTGYDYAYSIKQTSDGRYIIAGYTGSNNGDVTGNLGSYDCWIVKLHGTGMYATGGIQSLNGLVTNNIVKWNGFATYINRIESDEAKPGFRLSRPTFHP